MTKKGRVIPTILGMLGAIAGKIEIPAVEATPNQPTSARERRREPRSEMEKKRRRTMRRRWMARKKRRGWA